MHDHAVFDLFFRKNPFHGEFTVFAGLEECIKFIQNFKFSSSGKKFLMCLLCFCIYWIIRIVYVVLFNLGKISVMTLCLMVNQVSYMCRFKRLMYIKYKIHIDWFLNFLTLDLINCFGLSLMAIAYFLQTAIVVKIRIAISERLWQNSTHTANLKSVII